MIEQVVEFSTNDENEFELNSSLNGKYGITTNTLQKFTWEWINEGLHRDQSPYSTMAERGIPRGIVLRFRPNYQFPFKSLSIDKVDIPFQGMISRLIGMVTLQVSTLSAPITPGYDDIEWSQLVSLWHLWECENFKELFDQKMKVVLSQFDPAITGTNGEKVYQLNAVGNGDYSLYIAPNWQITLVGYPFQNFGRERIDNFFGTRDIVDGAFDFPGPISLLFQKSQLPRDDKIYLNSRIVVQSNPEMSFSRNMQNIDQTQVVATFNLQENQSKTHYTRPGYYNDNKRFVGKNQSNTPVVTTVRRDFCCVHYIDFWFTYGQYHEPLYEEHSAYRDPVGGVPTPTTNGQSILRYKPRISGSNFPSWFNRISPSVGYSQTYAFFRNTTTNLNTSFGSQIFKNISIHGVFNKCDCEVDRENVYIKP